ncbi:MAG: cyclic nucleotide-binding domain-containing protein [Anaerolineae bacterium]|nr:cyclic nucleotide-binding domain-containing protein [Anaerolineae bacterium]
MGTTSFWDQLHEEARQPDAGGRDLWTWLKARVDLAQYRPRAAPNIIARQLSGREGDYVILKNPDIKTYYRLSERDYFLWVRMDGMQTVKDLVVAYFLQYGAFAFTRVASLIEALKAGAFLSDPPVDVYQQVNDRLQRHRLTFYLNQVWKTFREKPFAISGLDHLFGSLYRWGGWLLFTWPVQILSMVIAVVGLYMFVQIFSAGDYDLITTGGSYGLGVIALLAANLVSIFLHEMAHALTVKHYGREVRRGGFLIYFGLPAFFVDTTDIWLEDKRARLAVSWAGPYSSLILAGSASIVLTLWPNLSLNTLLFKFASLTYLTAFLNLNPLLELDGYFILMDWLEIPMLRRKSLDFIRTGLWDKLKHATTQPQTPGSPASKDKAPVTGRSPAITRIFTALRAFSREERIFSIFGLLSAAWTAYAIFVGIRFWQVRLASAVRELWTQKGIAGQIVLVLGGIAIAFPIVLSIGTYLFRLVRKIAVWVVRRGFLDNTEAVAATILCVTVILAALPGVLDYVYLYLPIGLIGLILAAFFAGWNASHYAGSRLAPPFWLWMSLALLLLLQDVTHAAMDAGFIGAGFGSLFASMMGYAAYTVLFLSALFLLARTNLRTLSPPEKVLMTLGLGATYMLTIVISRTHLGLIPFDAGVILAVGRTLSPILFLTALIPSLFAFWRTHFAPAWTMLALAMGVLLLAALLDFPLYPAYLVLAAAFFLHHLTYARITLSREGLEARLSLSDRQRLHRAFTWTMSAILRQFREIMGDHQTQFMIKELNHYALAANWRVRVGGGQVNADLPATLSLIEQGEVYATILTLFLDLVADEIGDKLTVRTLQHVYDALPWEEREIGALYLFPDVERAETLSREFEATHQSYLGMLRRMPLFATMDDNEIGLLCARLRSESYAPGQAIVRQGERGDRFYIIVWGLVEVEVRNEHGVSEVIDQLDRGDYFGELALLRDASRNATCRTVMPTDVLSLSRRDFDQLVKAHFDMRDKVDHSITWASLLRQMPLFAELSGRQIRSITAQLREQVYAAGAILIRQGEIGDAFYVIASGRLQVFVARDGVEQVVAELGPGEYVGEIALLLQVPRTATVKALVPTRVLALHKDDFDRLIAEQLYVSRGLERQTSRRMIDLRRVASTGGTL